MKVIGLCIFVAYCVFGLCCGLRSQARFVDRALVQKQPLFNEDVSLAESIRYTLYGLHPGTRYEVRVSYPATVRFCALERGFLVTRQERTGQNRTDSNVHLLFMAKR